jgi:hypothetical protein
MGKHVSFDEMMYPNRSSLNKIRQYIKNKPRKYGTKAFAACDAEHAYCLRFELYLGKKDRHGDTSGTCTRFC